ncbi:cyclin-dependent kinase F-4-like [Carica papaya]|uniref:cyclin-dependent kinase F-4-like n=1 Tax=Carica papaya TaxID=3649 RepID=UPI000B8D0429|nr:cyclin-dependent kinase F-4-like [Carica papaya]
MEKFKLVNGVGEGGFGSVFKAINKETGETVAVKKLKKPYNSWQEVLNLKEVKSLQRLNHHPHIVGLKEVVMEHSTVYFIFEYMDFNLLQLIKQRQGFLFSDAKIRNWCFQIFQALVYMHQRGYFHRDLKPENLLATNGKIKIGDFGLAKEISSQPPYTDYVATRWYRAPEILLGSHMYGAEVDMWAMGAIMAELFTLRPLYPGKDEIHQIYKICEVLGTPTEETWPNGLNLAKAYSYRFPSLAGQSLSTLIPSAGEDAIHLIKWLCSWDPCKRPTAAQCLHHPFFQSCFTVPRLSLLPLQQPGLTHKKTTTLTHDEAGSEVIYREKKAVKRINMEQPPPGFTPKYEVFKRRRDPPPGFEHKVLELDLAENLAKMTISSRFPEVGQFVGPILPSPKPIVQC